MLAVPLLTVMPRHAHSSGQDCLMYYSRVSAAHSGDAFEWLEYASDGNVFAIARHLSRVKKIFEQIEKSDATPESFELLSGDAETLRKWKWLTQNGRYSIKIMTDDVRREHPDAGGFTDLKNKTIYINDRRPDQNPESTIAHEINDAYFSERLGQQTITIDDFLDDLCGRHPRLTPLRQADEMLLMAHVLTFLRERESHRIDSRLDRDWFKRKLVPLDFASKITEDAELKKSLVSGYGIPEVVAEALWNEPSPRWAN